MPFYFVFTHRIQYPMLSSQWQYWLRQLTALLFLVTLPSVHPSCQSEDVGTPPEQTTLHRWSDLRKRSLKFSKLYQSLMVSLVPQQATGNTRGETKGIWQEECNYLEVVLLPGWLVGLLVRVCTLLPDCFPPAVTETTVPAPMRRRRTSSGKRLDGMERWLAHLGLDLLVLQHRPRQKMSLVQTWGSNSSHDFTALPLQ